MWIRTTAAFAAIALVAAGCGGSSSDKAGGASGHVRVLRVANGNDEPGELAVFAHEVERASHGRLRISFLNNYRRHGDDNPEPGIVSDVHAGKVDLGWVGARAFKDAGSSAFDPLIAPFAVTDYATEQRVLASDVATSMLRSVQSIGVRGVALLPGPMRHLALRTPWKTPADLRGMQLGAPAGIGSEAFSTLGATPVVAGTGKSSKRVDGAEEHVASLVGNFLGHDFPYVGATPLWPRPLVVIASPKVFNSLSAEDAEALRTAGASAVLPMLTKLKSDEKQAVPKLCAQGATFTAVDVAKFRTALEPLSAEMRKDPANRDALSKIERLAAGGKPGAPACPAAANAAASGLHEGEYAFTLTKADTRRREAGRNWTEALPEKFRIVIEGNHMTMWVTEAGKDEEVGLEEDFSTFKDRIQIGDITGRFDVADDGSLRFGDIHPSGEGDDFVFATHPWKKVR